MIDYSARNWLGLVFRIHGTVLPRIGGRIALVTAIAVVAAYAHIEHALELPIPGVVHAMVGVALGLLLVFRTNASYDRYWEGRKILGGLVKTCRDLARQSKGYLPESMHRDAGRYIISLFATVRRALRDERDWSELEDVLTGPELEHIDSAESPPLEVVVWFTQLLHRAGEDGLSDERLRLFDQNLSEFIELWCGAQRIVTTPVPFAYAHHIKAFLTVFCVTAPLALLSPMGWYTPVASAVVAYGLFGIDEIGVEIEDPFGHDANDLPVDEIGERVRREVVTTLAL